MIFQTTPELDKTIAEACVDSGVNDPVELIRRAISLYVLVSRERLVGGEVLIQSIDGDLKKVKVL